MASFEHIVENLNFFSNYPYQLAIVGSETIKISPTYTIDNNSIVDFNAQATPDLYKNLSEVYLNVSVQILKKDLTKYTETDEKQGFLAPNFLHNLFKDVKIFLNGTQVLSIDQAYPVLQFIESSLNYDKITLGRLATQGLFINESKSKELTRNSCIVQFYAKLSLINTQKFIIPGVGINFRLTLNNDDYYLIEEEIAGSTSGDKKHTSSKVKIHEINLRLKHYKARDDFNLYLEQSLNNNYTAVYEFTNALITTSAIPQNSINFSIANMYSGKRPILALFCLTTTERFNGSRLLDPHVYSTCGLQEFSFLINGLKSNCEPFIIKNTKEEKKYAHVYHALHDAINISNENESTLVDYENYLEKCFFIAHDFRNFGSGSYDLKEPSLDSTIGIDMKFDIGLKEPLIAILYTLHNRRFEISASRVVTNIE